MLCNALLTSRKIVCELHKTECPGYSGIRTLCETTLKLLSLRIINKTKFYLNLVCRINVQKFAKSGIAYFYDYDTETCETSHTVYEVFTRFTRHCCLNKSIGKAWHRLKGPFQISVWVKISLSALLIYSVTTVIRENSLPKDQIWVPSKWWWHWRQLYCLKYRLSRCLN